MAFLTVREAAERVGKSPSSIRRLIYPIIKIDTHADRSLIQPSVEEAFKLRMSGESFPWKVSEELLSRVESMESPAEYSPPSNAGKGNSAAEVELLAMLRRELEIKNKQITQQSELISKHADLLSGLSERLREGNLLMATLQQRLSLNDGRGDNGRDDNGRDDKAKHIVDATTANDETENDENQSIEVNNEAVVVPSSTPAKKGFFKRLFR